MKIANAMELAAKYIQEANRNQPVPLDTMKVLDEYPEDLGPPE